MSVGKRRHPPSSLSSGVTPLVRAKALPERTEAPAGLAFQVSLPYAGRTWVDPARRACPTSAGASARRRRRLNAPEIQVRVNVSLRVRAGTPAHPGSHAGGDARAPRLACGRGRPRTQATLSLPSPQAGGDARAPRLACRRGRPPTQADRAHPACTFHQSPHAGGDARAPRRRSVCRLRKRAGTPAHPGGAQSAVSASGRGRPRTQDAYGSIILHIALNAQSP